MQLWHDHMDLYVPEFRKADFAKSLEVSVEADSVGNFSEKACRIDNFTARITSLL